MENLIGYALVSENDFLLQRYSNLPNFVKLLNGDDVYGFSSGEIFSDQSRIIPIVKIDNPPGEWYKALREETLIYQEKVISQIVYSDHPDIDEERSHMTCSPFQGRMALSDVGLLAQAQAAVDASDEKTKVAWEYALVWNRTSPMIETLGTALGLTDVQIDNLFKEAQKIQA